MCSQLKKIHHPKLVFTTGPHAVRQAYVKFMRHTNVTFDAYRRHKMMNNNVDTDLGTDFKGDIFKSRRYHQGMSGKVIRKETYPKSILKPKTYFWDKVEYNGTLIKCKERIEKESGVVYWKKQTYGNKSDKKICENEQKKWRAYQQQHEKRKKGEHVQPESDNDDGNDDYEINDNNVVTTKEQQHRQKKKEKRKV